MTPENNMEDLRSRVVQIEHRVTEFAPRITALETWKNQKDVSDAEIKIILSNLVEGVKGIKGGVSKILWAIGASVLVAIVTWMLSGGLVKAREVAFGTVYGAPEMTVRSFMPETKQCSPEKPIYVASYCRSLPKNSSFK